MRETKTIRTRCKTALYRGMRTLAYEDVIRCGSLSRTAKGHPTSRGIDRGSSPPASASAISALTRGRSALEISRYRNTTMASDLVSPFESMSLVGSSSDAKEKPTKTRFAPERCHRAPSQSSASLFLTGQVRVTRLVALSEGQGYLQTNGPFIDGDVVLRPFSVREVKDQYWIQSSSGIGSLWCSCEEPLGEANSTSPRRT
ncbi:hypothetical protein L207DRAFT_112642 [Hyaloscypha variabilis F]|uniref:Uncharacterized protein n=1 Tax=Hyaloscypha variabilis (strain UAMH 11265 / GT02V1 / F) TaxID=1149755 RepID=A0A2J6RA02_HYAVF|nr:hypothetical protein L207DRAFT_112642 [Hyaloscypha variabilis F]